MRLNFRLFVLAAGMLALLVSCQEEIKESPTKNYITGKLEGLTGNERIVLQSLQVRSVEVVDTIVPDIDGNFKIAPKIDDIGFYRVFISNNNFFNFITQPAETLKITANVNDLESTYAVEGSAETDALAEFNGFMNSYVAEMDSLRMEMQNAASQRNQQQMLFLQNHQMQKRDQTAEEIRQFIRANSNKLAAASAVRQFDPEVELELYELVLRDLGPVIGSSEIYQDLAEQVEQTKKLMPGAVLPDMISNDVNGKSVSLSSALASKYTLVDFWAAWCKPCRAENPNVVAAYKKYSPMGFTVVGVSLDRTKEDWVNAIQEDKLDWLQLSDLQYWESPSAKLYNIRGIPANFLIDSEMRIIGKNLRGPELEAKLAELLES